MRSRAQKCIHPKLLYLPELHDATGFMPSYRSLHVGSQSSQNVNQHVKIHLPLSFASLPRRVHFDHQLPLLGKTVYLRHSDLER